MAFTALDSRWILGSTALLLISGTIMLMFFVILSGVRDITPFNKTWFLQVDTSEIIGARRPLSQWTYFFICSARNKNCGSPVPALPIGYAWPGGSLEVPQDLVGSFAKNTTSRYFYYIWRLGWVSYLIGLFFVSLAWLVALLSVWTRLGSGISALLVAFGLFWHTIAASLMTTAFVKACNSFHRMGIAARVGPYAFGFTWGAWAALLLSLVLLIMCIIRKKNKSNRNIRSGKKSRFWNKGPNIDTQPGSLNVKNIRKSVELNRI